MPILPLLFAAAGAGAMYLLDPKEGAMRRQQLQEQLNKLQKEGQTWMNSTQQEINRQLEEMDIDRQTHYTNDQLGQDLEALSDYQNDLQNPTI
jgi:gas vesicle protein